ncbi:MAG: discoidin domain-containing protein [Minisyncoccota bacterium]
MKKYFKYIFLFSFILLPFITHAQSTTIGTCTGEIRTDLAAAQDCINKATAQGKALGYDISCKVEQLGLGGFTDPTSGKDYILNGVCTVDGSPGHGAYLLAGFTAQPGSNAIVQSVNPGWDILKTEIGYDNAFYQCGGKAPYGSVVNGVSVYSCTPPPGASQPVALSGSTKVSNSTSGTVIANQVHVAIFDSIKNMVSNLLKNYDSYTKSTLGFALSDVTTSPTPVSSQCFIFSKNIQFGDTGNDVFALTYALKNESLLFNTTTNFDATVMTAVKRFQEAHSTEILNIIGLTQGTGIVGEKTRAYLNSKCLVPSYIASNTQTVNNTTQQPTLSCPDTTRSGIQNGKYRYTFSKNTDNTWTVTLNNPAYSTSADSHYVRPNFFFVATNALDLNRQNQAWFNYSPSSLPGTPEGNTFYADMFGSFNNAYYDWDNMTKDAQSCTSSSIISTGGASVPTTPASPLLVPNQVRYVKISVKDWDTLPLAIREITVQGLNNTVIRPVSISATNFDSVGYQPPANAIDGNENTIWRATKSVSTCTTTDATAGRGTDTSSGRACQVDGDLQVLTLDLGKIQTVDRIKVMNYGLTNTRVFVIEVSQDGNKYIQIAEVRAQQNAPIADKGIVYGVISAVGTVGPIQY